MMGGNPGPVLAQAQKCGGQSGFNLLMNNILSQK